MPLPLPRQEALAGFGLSLDCALLYLSMLILMRLSGMTFKASQVSLSEFWAIASGERALASCRVIFGGPCWRR